MNKNECAPETLRGLRNAELNKTYDDAVFALEAAKEAVLTIQDERYRRYYATHVTRKAPDWPRD